MASRKDKDYHKLRNPEKYFGEMKQHSTVRSKLVGELSRTVRWCHEFTSEEAEAREAYDKLWAKYGMKSMVADKRRRTNTRKSNQMNKVHDRRIKRAKDKQGFHNLLNEDEE